MTDHDFPSSRYAVSKIAGFMGWELVCVESGGQAGIDVEKIIACIDEETLFVATSHVYFKFAYIQNVAALAARSKEVGALTLIDGYHGPGTIPVDAKALGDFYIGGCLKWRCGGPGNAFLYVDPAVSKKFDPCLTGWWAHRSPFTFVPDMDYVSGSYKFLSGPARFPLSTPHSPDSRLWTKSV